MTVTREDLLFNYPEYGNADPETLIDTTLEFAEKMVRRAAFPDPLIADKLVMAETGRRLNLTPYGMQMSLKKDAVATVHDADIRRIRDAVGSANGVF